MATKKINIEQEALGMVTLQKGQWEDATVFVTDRVAFQMKDLLRRMKKNYYGVFDTPIDPITGRRKTWYPLTEQVVEFSVKNIDLDTKDINLRAKNGSAIGMMPIVRAALKNQLDEMYFGESLDMLERDLCIHGTAVWKTTEVKDKDGKPSIRIDNVDLINLYCDPTAKNLQETDLIERALMTKEEFMAMDGWDNKEDVAFHTNLNPNDERLRNTANGAEMISIYEWWGDMPKSYITGLEKDGDTMINGHIVVSGLETGSGMIHLVEKNKKQWKPYEEVWFSQVPGRWYGRGPAERVLMLQLWMNTIVNIRINRSYVSQLGIFKIRKGSGITPQMVGRLAANGALSVRDMGDIEQFVMQEASQASYLDEQSIQSISERVTQTFEVATGEALPASTSATSTVIQSRSAQSSFVFVKEGIGFFLQRWLKRHALPIIQKRLDVDEIIRVTGEVDEVREFDEKVVNELLYRELEKMTKKGKFFTAEDVVRERQRAVDQLVSQGRDRFVKLKEKMDMTKYDVQVFITNEEIDKAVLVTNLIQSLQIAAASPELQVDTPAILRQIFDTLGLEAPKEKKQGLQTPPQQPQAQQPVPAGIVPEPGGQVPTEQTIATGALTQAGGPQV